MGTKFVLAVYFFHKYSKVKAGVPLVWGAGFFIFGLSQIPVLAMRNLKDTDTSMYFALLAAILAALSLALLYYGSALLFFTKGSFMRKKLSIIFFVVMLAVIVMFPLVMTPENVLRSVFVTVAMGFIFPILFIVALIFFTIWSKLEPANPRKFNVFLVGMAWLMYSLLNGATSIYYLRQFDWIFAIIATVSFLLLLYGMTVGKATGH